MRAVKDRLPTPSGEGEELEGPRSTGAVEIIANHLAEKDGCYADPH